MNTYELIEYFEKNNIEFVIDDIYNDDVDVVEYIDNDKIDELNDKIDELNDKIVDIEIIIDVDEFDDDEFNKLIDDIDEIDNDVDIIYYDSTNELIIKNK